MGKLFYLNHFREFADFIHKNPKLLHEEINKAFKILEYAIDSVKKNKNLQNGEDPKGLLENGCRNFIRHALKGDAEEEAKADIYKLCNKAFLNLQEKRSKILQLLKSYNLQKEIFAKIIPSYTPDPQKATIISYELTQYQNYLTETAFLALAEVEENEKFKEKELASSVIDNTVNGVLAFDTKMNLTEANTAVCSMLSIKKDDIIGKNIFEVLPYYKDTDVGLTVKAVLTGVQVFISERSFIKRKGFFEANLTPLYDSEGKITGGLIIVHETTHRKKAEDDLKQKNWELIQQQHENRKIQIFLEQVTESVPCLIFLYDVAENSTVYANQKLLEITGYSPEELKELESEVIGRLIVPEDVGGDFTGKDLSRFDIYKDKKPGEYLEYEFKIRHKNGELRWLRTKSKVFKYDRNGTPLQILGTAEDITELKNSEENINQAQDYYLRILEDFPVPVWRTGQDGKFNYFNKSWLSFTGYTLDEELNAPPAEKIHPDDLDESLKIFETSFARQEPFNREYRLKRHDGIYRYVFDAGKPIYDLQGNFTGYIGACFDLQDRKDNEILIEAKNRELTTTVDKLADARTSLTLSNTELEKRVKERTVNLVAREEQIRTITDALPVLIAYVDKDLNCRFINKAIEKFLHKSREEIAGRPVKELMQEKSYRILKPRFEKVLRGKALNFEFHADHKDLGSIYFSIDFIPHETRKDVIGFYALLYNITDRKKAAQTMEKLYEEANKRNSILNRVNTVLDNFVYTASHDLKSPVYNLEGLVDILKEIRTNGENDEGAQVVEMIARATGRLKKTIDDLIKITKIQQESDLQENEKISIIEVYNHVKSDLDTQIKDCKAEITEHFEVTELFYPGSHLRSILYNLISNALKYRRPDVPVKINVSTSAGDGTTELKITDNGIGMSAVQQRQLFKPFHRLHPRIEGSGIGLYSIKRLIEINGGKIEVSSTPEEGSEFTVYFNTRANNQD